MELYTKIVEIVDANLIYCLVPMVLTLLVIEYIYKQRFETRKALLVIRWIIIFYSVVRLIGVIACFEEITFIDRVVDFHRVVSFGLFLISLILPFTLLYKKLSLNFLYVVLVSICMKISFYFERFVIVATSFHRDYPLQNKSSQSMYSFLSGIGVTFLQGMVIAMLFLLVLGFLNQRKLAN